MTNHNKLRAGDWIEVRNKEEILASLDQKGQLDGMPFMPQMFQYCGQRLQVYKRAHKTCDTVNETGGRLLADAVHLETRCDGKAYGGCQAACLIYWKEAWIKRAAPPSTPVTDFPTKQQPADGARQSCGCREEDVWAGTKTSPSIGAEGPVYVCQATQVPAATAPLRPWDIRQYVEDLESGNVGIARMVRGFIYMGYNSLVNAGIGLGRPLRQLYDLAQCLWRGVPYPRKRGRIPAGTPTPRADPLDLQPGDWVRVRSYDEILRTLDPHNKNRGLYFDAEMVPYCGKEFQVLAKVRKIIDEKTGRMMNFKTPCFLLKGAVCQARYSECRLFCPRAIYSYWREIWLERVSKGEEGAHSSSPSSVRTALDDSAVGDDDRVAQVGHWRDPAVSS
jgi:hypothetical protein